MGERKKSPRQRNGEKGKDAKRPQNYRSRYPPPNGPVLFTPGCHNNL
jgi:hypothetical protein